MSLFFQANFEQNGSPPEVKIIDSQSKEDGQFQRDIARAIIKSFGWSFFFASLLKLAHDIFIFVSPILLKRIIRYAKKDSQEELWKGIIYALSLFLTTTVQSVMLAKYFYEMYLIGKYCLFFLAAIHSLWQL